MALSEFDKRQYGTVAFSLQQWLQEGVPGCCDGMTPSQQLFAATSSTVRISVGSFDCLRAWGILAVSSANVRLSKKLLAEVPRGEFRVLPQLEALLSIIVLCIVRIKYVGSRQPMFTGVIAFGLMLAGGT